MIPRIVSEGVVSTDILSDHPSISSIGRDWVIVEAMSDADALRQAKQYDQGKHPMQRKMETVFEDCEALDSMPQVIDLIYTRLYPFVIPGSITFEVEHLYGKRPWIAEVRGFDDNYGFDRLFLDCKIGHSNYMVISTYLLSPDKVYDISAPTGLRSSDRYFGAIVNNELTRLSRSEVQTWLRSR